MIVLNCVINVCTCIITLESLCCKLSYTLCKHKKMITKQIFPQQMTSLQCCGQDADVLHQNFPFEEIHLIDEIFPMVSTLLKYSTPSIQLLVDCSKPKIYVKKKNVQSSYFLMPDSQLLCMNVLVKLDTQFTSCAII